MRNRDGLVELSLPNCFSQKSDSGRGSSVRSELQCIASRSGVLAWYFLKQCRYASVDSDYSRPDYRPSSYVAAAIRPWKDACGSEHIK